MRNEEAKGTGLMTDKEREWYMRLFHLEAIIAALPFALGDAIFVLFAVSRGASDWYLAALVWSPSLAGAAVCLVTSLVASRLRIPVKSSAVASSALHSLVYFGMAYVAWEPHGVTWLPDVLEMVILSTLSVTFAAVSAVSWFSWIGEIVPSEVRGTHFAVSSMLRGAASIACATLCSVLIREWGASAYTILFTCAGFAKVAMCIFFAPLRPPQVRTEGSSFKEEEEEEETAQLLDKSTKRSALFLVIITTLTVTNIIAGTCSPFYVVHFTSVTSPGSSDASGSYYTSVAASTWAISLVVATTFRLIGLPIWGKLGDKWGQQFSFIVAQLVSAVAVFSWATCIGRITLFIAQAFNGFSSAGLEILSVTTLLDSTESKNRQVKSSLFWGMQSIATAIGALLSSLLVFEGLSYVILFTAASIGRTLFGLIALGFYFVLMRGSLSAHHETKEGLLILDLKT
ncbi:hypothetical protein Pelo_16142 [Pelomyxa schiedti]|nr:hypothetical protein Pelo_16142 [Pelomyxa schiedti]